jgi:two-component sensor histidine kinase
MKVKTIMIVAIVAGAGMEIMNINQVFLIISSIVLLAISLVVIVCYHRLKQKSEKAGDMQQLEIQMKAKALTLVSHQKDWLLQEVHHRVKNNLQVISSLLSLQSRYITNDAAQKAINESRQRIHALSLIQLHSIGENGLLYVNMQSYICELANHIKEDFENSGEVAITLDIDDVQMDVPYAVPLSLILNEAVTNALQHAFPSKCKGTITISLKRIESNNFVLTVKDNGIGLPQHFSNGETLGLSLIKGLSGDIDAHLNISNHNGTSIIAEFFYCASTHYEEIS